MVFGDYMNVKCYVCIGGISVFEDIIIFKEKLIYIVVGIFGRVYDMISRNYFRKFLIDCILVSFECYM